MILQDDLLLPSLLPKRASSNPFVSDLLNIEKSMRIMNKRERIPCGYI